MFFLYSKSGTFYFAQSGTFHFALTGLFGNQRGAWFKNVCLRMVK
jgi:hypothetical protein